MRIWFIVLLSLTIPFLRATKASDNDAEDDFSEFDEDDEDFPSRGDDKPTQNQREEGSLPAATGQLHLNDEDDEVKVEAVEDDEYNHFEDEDEFEGYRVDDELEEQEESIFTRGAKADRKKGSKSPFDHDGPPKTLNFAKVPSHLRINWENYYLEILMIVGLVVYCLNFITGKTKNQRLANAWYNAHKALLEANFALVGDDGAKDTEDIDTPLQKESESFFTLWCSGRTCCEGMLVEIKLLKRQDLVSVIGSMIKAGANRDQIRVKVSMDDMDTFVFCLGQKRAAAKLAKEMADITTFCPERKALDKTRNNLPTGSNYCIMSEIPEVTGAMMDPKMMAVLTKFPDAIDSVHFSDQYTGPKLADDQMPSELPVGKKVLIFTFNIPNQKGAVPLDIVMESMKPLMMLVFYFIEKVKRYRMSREGRNKAEKNRTKVAESFWRSIHAAKAEKAQEEREKKRREIKERIKEIEDPEKQRKLEEKELRKERKKAAPKMKQLKVKAL